MPNEPIENAAQDGHHKKHVTRYAVITLVLVGILGAWYKFSHRTKAAPPPVPQSVETQTIEPRTVPDVIDTYGTIVSLQTVEITPQTSGVITSVRITDGQEVRRGQLLFTIDPRPLQADLAQARGTLQRDAALAADAQDTATRYAPLAATGAMDKKPTSPRAILRTRLQERPRLIVRRSHRRACRSPTPKLDPLSAGARVPCRSRLVMS